MILRRAVSFVLCAVPTLAAAEPLTLDLPGPVERTAVSYICSDEVSRSVDYVNLPDNSLALLDIDGAPRVFVGVLAGSGAKYASGAFVWWTKGSQATLTDETKSDMALATCNEKANGNP